LNGTAAARLYDEHVDAIYSYLARRLGPDRAIEVVGEVFEHALQAPRSEASASELGWLLAIATAVLRRHSDTERARLLDWTDHAGNPSSAVVNDPLLGKSAGDGDGSTTRAVMAAVADLEPVDRDLLFLVAWERCSHRVVAEALRIPAGSVRSRLASIRKDLKGRVTTDPALDSGGTE
jgi:RNA polymerase sigma-70 factor (ECF subfamily)